MTIKIRFEANQKYQRDAIDAVVNVFAGQESAGPALSFAGVFDVGALPGTTPEGQFEFDETVFGNVLTLSPEILRKNLREIQDRPLVGDDGEERPSIPETLRQPLSPGEAPLDFSVEMETGTGKTYVYIRTIAELYQKYGWSKFVVVVPSVAIREGVIASLNMLREHIAELYDGLKYTPYVYSSGRLGGVRSFATSPGLQIMVINIDAFSKESNIMNRHVESMGMNRPIDYVRHCRPIVLMDEPQNMESGPRQEAIASLHPLFKVRYSATHKDLKHLVYRLTPVDAYDYRLVKRIGVLSIVKDDDFNEAFVEVSKIHAKVASVTATARIHRRTAQGTRALQVTLRKDDDLYELSGERDLYRGWSVEDIHVGQNGESGVVEFSNGRRVREAAGSTAGDQHQRLMIRQAVESHFEKEMQLFRLQRRGILDAPIKPLTLFFIDKVANYHPAGSKFRRWFEEEYHHFKSDARFRALDMPAVTDVHDGYFATSAKGEPKDSSVDRDGVTKDTKETAAAFERIMQKKEELLGFDEPLRFIFSHSALVEGWDNPNVFTICNLQEGRSVMRRRQQIGRGLRLPVMTNGERCRHPEVNLLTVIAHEEFAAFARGLQEEIESETGTSFSGRIVNVRDKIALKLRPEKLVDPAFLELWDRICGRTTYKLSFDTDALVEEAKRRINEMDELEPVRFRISKDVVSMSSVEVAGSGATSRGEVEVTRSGPLPDVVGELTRRVALSRATIVRILSSVDNLAQVKVNPAAFIDQVEQALKEALYSQVSKGIKYSPTGARWEATLFESLHQEETFAKASFVVPVTKSVTDKVVCDSQVEVDFATFLEHRADVPLFVKLPGWFKISTPLGNYNPDWALVRDEAGGRRLYLVRETKGTGDIEALRWESEGWKIRFGEAHFACLNVDYMFHEDSNILIEVSGHEKPASG